MKPNYFGLNINNSWSPPIECKFSSYRSWDNGTRWNETNTAPGVFNFAVMERWLETIALHGVTDIVVELGATPNWCSSNPGYGKCNYGGGCCAPPNDLHWDGSGPNLHWRQWCAAVGKFFAGHTAFTAHFSPWNEFCREGDYPTNLSWLGTPAQMVRLAEDARAILYGRGRVTATGETVGSVLRSVGLNTPAYSGAKGHMLAPNACTGQYFIKKYLPYIEAPGAVEAAEVMTIHTYNMTAQEVVSAIQGFQQAMSAVSRQKPLWLTEFSWGNTAGTQPPNPAAYVSECATMLETVVDRIYWYSYAWQNAPLYANGELTAAGREWNKLQGG